MEKNLSLLVVGDLGRVGLQSLASFETLNLERICVISDGLGRKWIEENIPEVHFHKLCFHENSEISSVLRRVELNTDYVKFGTNKFIEIMMLKWLLILDIFAKHPSVNLVAYSDLDVVWMRSPSMEVEVFMQTPKLFAIQEDFNLRTGRSFLCPGVMFWRNSAEAKDLLESLINAHNYYSSSGNPMPDDKVLNELVSIEGLHSSVHLLPRAQFVIGHRIHDLVAQIRGYKLQNLDCYHANYATHESTKLARMSASGLTQKQRLKRARFLLVSMKSRLLR